MVGGYSLKDQTFSFFSCKGFPYSVLGFNMIYTIAVLRIKIILLYRALNRALGELKYPPLGWNHPGSTSLFSKMSPNYVQTGGSPWLIFQKECMNPFASFQQSAVCKEEVKTCLRRCPKKSKYFFSSKATLYLHL